MRADDLFRLNLQPRTLVTGASSMGRRDNVIALKLCAAHRWDIGKVIKSLRKQAASENHSEKSRFSACDAADFLTDIRENCADALELLRETGEDPATLILTADDKVRLQMLRLVNDALK